MVAASTHISKSEESLEDTNDDTAVTTSHSSTNDARGWKAVSDKTKGKQKVPDVVSQGEHGGFDEEMDEDDDNSQSVATRRKKFLKELAARLLRDRQLRYVQREFEMQRLMMGKGARRKIQGREKVDDDESMDEDGDDALDARGGRALKSSGKPKVDSETWKPRVYKWKLERK